MGTVSKFVVASAAGVTVLGGVLGLCSVLLARKVVASRSVRYVPVLRSDAESITLQLNVQTRHPGEFGLWYQRHRHARIGRVLRVDELAGTVTRAVLSSTGTIPVTPHARWTGHVFARPEEIDPDLREVEIPVGGEVVGAWLFPSIDRETGGTWAIHVHGITRSMQGLNSERLTVLRSVPVARKAGHTSLVLSFRTDGGGTSSLSGVSTLGQTEWEDIDAAISFALRHGAARVVLFAWSMGANAALLAAERSVNRRAIAGLVLVGPALDWREVIRNGSGRAGLPAWCGDLALKALRSTVLSRLVGLREPIDFRPLDWLRPGRVRRPCLVIHSNGDREIPLELSRRFAAVNGDLVELAELPTAEHAWEYNSDPERFERTIATWLDALEPPSGPRASLGR